MASRPDSITGGCLCGSIRYTVTFPQDTPWPPKSATCQCTQCRKFTSSLLPSFLTISPSQISPWPLSSTSSPSPASTTSPPSNPATTTPTTPTTPNTYTEFASSTKGRRGFCSKCGSSLIWRNALDEKDDVDVFLGTVDKKWLVHEKEIGKMLARPNEFQFWCQNAVEGVSDTVQGGTRLLRDRGTEMK